MPMARYGAFAARSCAFLWHSVRAAPRGGGLSPATGNPFAGTDRTHADRLRARRLLAGVVDAVGLPVAGSVSGRPGPPARVTTHTCVGSCSRWRAIFTA